jgi:hypothetical protein
MIHSSPFEAIRTVRNLTSRSKSGNGVPSNDIFAWFRGIENTRFFVSESGRTGLGPVDTQVDDKVAILIGGNVPYILRKIPPRPGKDYYGPRCFFVGECFVHGAMQGEIGGNGEVVVDIEIV